MSLTWTNGTEKYALAVQIIRKDGEWFSQCDPSDIVACLRANPAEAAAVRGGLRAHADQELETALATAERERDDALRAFRRLGDEYDELDRRRLRAIADLRDRLALLASFVCAGCGCAADLDDHSLCWDCASATFGGWGDSDHPASASVSVGMRALAGRRILGH